MTPDGKDVAPKSSQAGGGRWEAAAVAETAALARRAQTAQPLCLKIWVEVQESGAWLVGQARRAAVPTLVQRLQPVRAWAVVQCSAATAIASRRSATGACTRVPCVLACQYVLDSQEAASCRNGRRAETASGGPHDTSSDPSVVERVWCGQPGQTKMVCASCSSAGSRRRCHNRGHERAGVHEQSKLSQLPGARDTACLARLYHAMYSILQDTSLRHVNM